MPVIPYVTEETRQGGERTTDIYSRLLKDRIIFLGSEINDDVANAIVAQIIFLKADDPKKAIHLYINSPGGVVSSGLAIYDTLQYLDCDINTYCIGMSASMGALLLSSGTPGKRFALPHSRIMIHQPSGHAGGTSKDIELQAQEINILKDQLKKILAQHTGQSEQKIEKDSDRDYYMSAQEAIEYGLVDHVIKPSTVAKIQT